jgi:peptidoglycan hydrolase CwlO-like protein
MGLTAEERAQIWAEFDDLEKRAAETNKRIEERKEEIARLIERLERIQRRLLRYC